MKDYFQVIMILSIFIQFMGAYLALRLIKITKSRIAWILISLAFLLMVLRRLTSFLNPDTFMSEVIALITSVLLLIGVTKIGPLFLSIRRSEEKLQSAQETLLIAHNQLENNVKERTFELAESEARYRAIVEDQSEFVCRYTTNYKFTFVNEAFCRFSQKTRKELIGQSMIPFIHTEDLEKVKQTINSAILENPIKISENRNILPSGEIFWIQWTNRALFNKQDEIVEYQAVGRDVTNFKNLEKEISRLDRLNLVGQMAAGIGHEIRNPMTTVRGFLQMLMEKEDCIKYKDYYTVMIDELDRANSIITEYLSLAKSKPEKLELNNLNKVIEAIYPLLFNNAIGKNKNVNIDLGDIQDLFLNKKEIRQLILNLVNNALEAMDSGGTVTIRTFSNNENVVLAVEDQGKEIQQDVLDKIGTPFFTTKESGTGLGLAVCYGIVARHNATINIETSPKGTIFYVLFKKANN